MKILSKGFKLVDRDLWLNEWEPFTGFAEAVTEKLAFDGVGVINQMCVCVCQFRFP